MPVKIYTNTLYFISIDLKKKDLYLSSQLILSLMSALLIYHLFNMLNIESSDLVFLEEILHFS